MLEGGDIEPALGVAELHQVERRQIAGRVVEEHVLRARIGGVDPPVIGAGVPLVDRGVVLDARIGRGPGRVADLLPQLLGRQRARDLVHRAVFQLPVALLLDRVEEGVGDAHGIVGILAGDRQIGLRVPVLVVDREVDLAVTLTGELDDALNVVLRDHGLAGGDDLGFQRRILLGIEAALVVGPECVVPARGDDQVEVLVGERRAGDQRGHLLLLDRLPHHVFLDVGMIEVDGDHLGGAAGGAAGLDGAGGAVADLEEAHQARGLAAARQGLVGGADGREIGAGAGAVLEQARFTDPEVHDAALVHQIVGDRLDEAGVGLRVFVGAAGLGELAGLEVDVVMALGGAVDAIGPVQAGVEPLGRIGSRHLPGQHVAHLVVIGLGVGLGVEIAALPAPIGPGAGETVEDLARVGLPAETAVLRQFRHAVLVGGAALQPQRHVVLGNRHGLRGHTGPAEVFLGQDVGGHLGELPRHLELIEPEDDRAIRIADFAGRRPEFDGVVRRRALGRESTLDTHDAPPSGARFGPEFP